MVARSLSSSNLTTGQKAAIALDALPLFEAEAARRKAQAPGQERGAKQATSDVADLPQETRPPLARDKAAKVVGTSGDVDELEQLLLDD